MIAKLLRSSILIPVFASAVMAQAPVQAGMTNVTTVSAPAPVTGAEVRNATVMAGAAIAPVGVTSKMQLEPVMVPASQAVGENVGTTRAMMGAGIAAVIIGLIVGGDVGTLVAVGGAVFALIGLYRYMQ